MVFFSLQNSFQSVEMPDSWVLESLKVFEHQLDIPDAFRITAMKSMCERFHKSLSILPEYNTLPVYLQKKNINLTFYVC